MHHNWRNKTSGQFKEEEHWKTLEKTSDMLIAGFQDDIKAKKNTKSSVHLNLYFQDCMKPSLRYWALHRSNLPIFKKNVINMGLNDPNQEPIEEDEQVTDI